MTELNESRSQNSRSTDRFGDLLVELVLPCPEPRLFFPRLIELQFLGLLGHFLPVLGLSKKKKKTGHARR